MKTVRAYLKIIDKVTVTPNEKRDYNVCELGPRGIGKSPISKEIKA